jgi:Fe-S-cluster containining protein
LSPNDLDERVDSLQCKGLCIQCCDAIAFPKRIRKEYPEMKLPGNPYSVLIHKVSKGNYVCPFLKEGRCSIYEKRPAICHLYGSAENLRCPFGCLPKGPLLTPKEGYQYLRSHGEATI